VSTSEPSTVLLDYTQDKVVVLDESGTFNYVSAAAERILGFEPAEIVGENAFEYIHPAERAAVRETFDSIIGKREFAAETAAYRHRASDGSWVWLESRMSNLTDDSLDGYVVSSREITDRVEAERQRAETERRLREIAATTDDVLWMFDGDWSELLFCNPAYEELFGMSVEAVAADTRSFLDAVHPEDTPVVESAMEALVEGRSVDIEYRVNPKRDFDRWVWVQGEPIPEDGSVARIVGFCRDVTDRRRRERQLVVMDNILRHNLRNQMTPILGNAELIEEGTGASVADRVAVIRRAGERLLETAEKQRDVVDLITRRPRVESRSLRDAVAAGVDIVTERYPQASVAVDLPAVSVDTLEEFRFVVVELVENALDHAEGETAGVRITAEADEDTVALCFDDDCPPIPEYDRKVLTGDHEMDAVYHSSGCGLWLVYWIVDLSDGEITVSTDGERGNRITTTLRRARE
jgi:PAS domain S-box-containing protein